MKEVSIFSDDINAVSDDIPVHQPFSGRAEETKPLFPDTDPFPATYIVSLSFGTGFKIIKESTTKES